MMLYNTPPHTVHQNQVPHDLALSRVYSPVRSMPELRGGVLRNGAQTIEGRGEADQLAGII